MSGPKTSRYTLTAEQRRILREAMELERKTKVAFENKEQLCKSMIKLMSEAYMFIDRAELISVESKKELQELQEIKLIRQRADKVVKDAGKISVQNGLKALKEQEMTLKKEYNNLMQKKIVLEQKLPKIEKDFKNELKEIVISGFQLSFANIGSDRKIEKNLYMTKIQDSLNEMIGLYFSTELREKWTKIQNKAKEIDNVEFLENFYVMAVVPFVKECRKYNEIYMQYGETYEDLMQEYKVMAEEAGKEVENIPFSENAIAQLKGKIEQLENIIANAAEQTYISQCIDEVMIELGYDLIGSREVTKKSGKHFRNELYLFDEGTAVSVTTSDDGQITMELGGLDNADRIPSEVESEQLCQGMMEFCTDYKEIEKRLIAKGIITKRISILPPEEQYAQIINTSDYNMKEKVGYFETTIKKKENVSNTILHKGV